MEKVKNSNFINSLLQISSQLMQAIHFKYEMVYRMKFVQRIVNLISFNYVFFSSGWCGEGVENIFANLGNPYIYTAFFEYWPAWIC